MCPDFKSSVEEQKGPHLNLNDLGAHPSWQYELREVDPFFDSCFLDLLIWSNDNAAHLMGSLWKVTKTLYVNMSGGDDSYFCNLPPSYSRGSSDLGIEPATPALASGCFTTASPGKL